MQRAAQARLGSPATRPAWRPPPALLSARRRWEQRDRTTAVGRAHPTRAHWNNGLIILLDGREGRDGRALLLISALYHCAAELQGLELWVVDAAEPGVLVALDLMRWDLGLNVRPFDADAESRLASARLYASISFGAGSWPTLARVEAAGIPTLLARQFPPAGALDAAGLPLIRAAHDPKAFARNLTGRLRALG